MCHKLSYCPVYYYSSLRIVIIPFMYDLKGAFDSIQMTGQRIFLAGKMSGQTLFWKKKMTGQGLFCACKNEGARTFFEAENPFAQHMFPYFLLPP